MIPDDNVLDRSHISARLEYVLLAVDGLSTGTVTAGEVTTLEHELGDDAVEGGTSIAVSLLASAESAEVLGALGGNVSAELHDDTLFLRKASREKDISFNRRV